LRKVKLDNRLNAYFATLRRSSLRDALKRSVENWQVYAAVTGSAVAMATNSSASLIYSGPVNTTVSVSSAPTGHTHTSQKKIQLKNAAGAPIGIGFNIIVVQDNPGPSFQFGAAGIQASQVDFLLSNNDIKRLSSNAAISGGAHTAHSHNGFVSGNHTAANQSISSGRRRYSGWTKTKGFAGFVFSTAGHQKDFGWVRLQYTVGANTLIDSLTVIDWGYQNNGTGITAGEGTPPPAIPEPSTAALALLAAGAAGVTALRRYRKSSAERRAVPTCEIDTNPLS
jgi:PEP-CTERM motif